MSNIIYTEVEQVKLQELISASNQFESFKQLILRSIHLGQDAQVVVQAVGFLDGMIKQTTLQIDSLKTGAAERALTKESNK